MSSVVGNWTIKIDWNCDGILDGTVIQNFKADGTWEISGEHPHHGRWFENKGLIIWTFDHVPNLIYTANVKKKSMHGIQGYIESGGIKGCFSGQKDGGDGCVSDTKSKGSGVAIGK